MPGHAGGTAHQKLTTKEQGHKAGHKQQIGHYRPLGLADQTLHIGVMDGLSKGSMREISRVMQALHNCQPSVIRIAHTRNVRPFCRVARAPAAGASDGATDERRDSDGCQHAPPFLGRI